MIMDLQNIKDEYSKLAKKYNLTSFQLLNEDFEIDKIDKQTDCLLRLIRKVMMEKIVNSLGFLEFLLNPINAPRIYLGYARTMSQEDKKEVEKIYSVLGELSISSLTLEIDYSEKGEAELIKKIYNLWNSVKPGFRKILKNMNMPLNNVVKKEKSYFG